MIETHLWDRVFHETAFIARPRRHCYSAWWGFGTFRTIHHRRVAYVMWHGKTIWLRSA